MADLEAAIEELQWLPYSERIRISESKNSAMQRPAAPIAEANVSLEKLPQLEVLIGVMSGMAQRIENIEVLLQQTVALLERKNRISIRFGRNQLSHLVKQFTLEMQKAKSGQVLNNLNN